MKSCCEILGQTTLLHYAGRWGRDVVLQVWRFDHLMSCWSLGLIVRESVVYIFFRDSNVKARALTLSIVILYNYTWSLNMCFLFIWVNAQFLTQTLFYEFGRFGDNGINIPYELYKFTWCHIASSLASRKRRIGHPHQGHGCDLEHHPMVRGEEASKTGRSAVVKTPFPNRRMGIIIVVCSVWKGFISNPSNGNRLFRYQSLNTYFFP